MGERGCQLSFLKVIKKSYVAQSCPTLCDSLRRHGLQPTRLLPWDLPGKGPRVGCKAYAAKSGLSFPPPGDLPNTGNKATSLASPVLASGFLTTESPGKHLLDYITESSRMRYGVGHYYIQVPVSCREFASFHLCSSLGQLHFHLKSFLLATRWQQQYLLYCISFASSEASKPHSCCGNRKSPGTILLGLAWIPHLFHICFSSIHCGRRKGMALISWTWDISPPLEAGTESTPLKLGVELRLGVEGRQFSPKNALTERKKKKKKMHRREKNPLVHNCKL